MPELGRSSEPRSWRSIVFPQPLGPTTATGSSFADMKVNATQRGDAAAVEFLFQTSCFINKKAGVV